MKPKTYRRLTRFLFLFLFLMFFLLYLLMGGAGRMPQKGGGSGWGRLHKEMGTIHLSEVRSGGFSLDELPVQDPTSPGEETFNDNVLRCDATLHNEGTVPIQVTLSVFGTQVLETDNQGLTGLWLDYPPGTDPFSGKEYAAWMEGKNLEKSDGGGSMTLYLPSPGASTLTLEVGETRQLALLLWVDSDEVDILTDLDRDQYSITAKLISRGI